MKKTAHKEKLPPATPSKKPLFLIVLLILIVGVTAFSLFRKPVEPDIAQQPPASLQQPDSNETAGMPAPNQQEQTHTEEQGFRMPPYFENPETVALAPVMDPKSVDLPAQPAYAAVQRNPKLIAQLPCFCYCERFGHQSLHDCYVTDHAVHCDICMKEALEADEMDRQGMTAQEIRSLIVSKYRPKEEHNHPH